MILGNSTEVKSLVELRALAVKFLDGIAKNEANKGATVVCMSGDLGAGKTAFVKCVASVLGITDVVTSPTFVLEKIYTIPAGSVVGTRFSKLIHIDAYRLRSGKETSALGFDEIIADKNNIVFIEWPENIHDALPKEVINLSFSYVDGNVRRVEERISR
ncbi:MAG: tRNA (adenosine(37)-N6)-threonylcarbamoyltransferase complex ATPase subunit type 1 TsaE [Candidatus Pacebacteria bacterium]|nr:tRNA (adenosine(37)-N6)-threonylcarbamoyltransferase complex ATPase subunit type 1 TsaE [Candidatus Paceibacterota bacterium]